MEGEEFPRDRADTDPPCPSIRTIMPEYQASPAMTYRPPTMTASTIPIPGCAVRVAAAALALVSVASVAAETPGTTVYKCPQANGAVLYADYPCKGGAVVDIRPGSAAPDAMQRLERARDEIDRAAVRRQANDELAALRREELNQRRRELEAAQSMEFAANSPDLSYAPAYGFYGPYVKPRANRPDIHRRAEHHRGVHENRVPAVIRRPHRG